GRYGFLCIAASRRAPGSRPDAVRDFAAQVGYTPRRIAVFGSGDTQFGGDELCCRAGDRLAKFYESPVPALKIEQSPRGSQERLVKSWLEGVLNNVAYIA